MIQKVHAYQTTDGQHWPTMELAQAREIEVFLKGLPPDTVPGHPDVITAIAHAIIKNKEKVMDILTMKKTSRPKARNINRKKEEAAP